jgi:hypothetical protein
MNQGGRGRYHSETRYAGFSCTATFIFTCRHVKNQKPLVADPVFA